MRSRDNRSVSHPSYKDEFPLANSKQQMIEMFDIRKQIESPVKGKDIRIDLDEEEGDDPGRYDTLDDD